MNERERIFIVLVKGDSNASDRELVICPVSQWGDEDGEHVGCEDDDGERDTNERK